MDNLFQHQIPTTLAEERKQKGKQWLEKLSKLRANEESYQTYPLIPEYRPRLSDPSPFWHVVHRQKKAFEVAAAHPEDVHVFAFEADSVTPTAVKGQRKFVVTHYPQLWHTIKHLAAKRKHASLYEVIPEGSACKLYFDLEFSRGINPERNGAEMVQIFIKFVCDQLLDDYKIKCSGRHVINLDATTEAKFSRHLIFNVPKTVFKDNIHAGNFVRKVCQRIKSLCKEQHADGVADSAGDDDDDDDDTRGPDAKKVKREVDNADTNADREHLLNSLNKLFVQTQNGQSELFVDQGVYTRNRNFRLYNCVKKGKNNPLVLDVDNQYKLQVPKGTFPLTSGDEAYQHRLFLDSLITNVGFTSSVRVLTTDTDGVDKALSHPPNSDACTEKQDPRGNVQEGFDHSPFPDLDRFIPTVVTKGGIQGDIRRWVYFTQGQLLIYDIIKNRWCDNVRRQHKSNNIMIIVDLRRSVYYQKCHDSVCKAAGYKSPDVPIPTHLLPLFVEDFDDDELLAAVVDFEQRENATAVECGPPSDEELLAAADEVEHNLKLGVMDKSESGSHEETMFQPT